MLLPRLLVSLMCDGGVAVVVAVDSVVIAVADDDVIIIMITATYPESECHPIAPARQHFMLYDITSEQNHTTKGWIDIT